MENEKDKKNGDTIDEQYLMSMMAGGVRKGGFDQEAAQIGEKKDPHKETRGKQQAKKIRDEDYESLFFSNTEGNARYGKTINIRPEFHERISRIVQVIGEDKISLYTYLDNVLSYHFREFGDQITKTFNDKYKPIL